MKRLQLLALSSVLLGAAQITHGSVLLGFNSFSDDTPDIDSTPDEAKSGWSGSVKSGLSYLGGSTDGFYGQDDETRNLGHKIYSAPPNSNNGYVDVGTGALFSGTAGTSGLITALLFDAASTGAATGFNVAWTFWTDNTKSSTIINGAGTSSPLTLASGSAETSDYKDFSLDLGSFFLPAGGYFEFVWNVTSGQASFNIDNIALVPEPGSMLGLGCLVGFGTLLRSRRRTGPAVIA